MSNQTNNFPQRKKHALDNFAFNLSEPVPNEQGKFSRLNWALSRNSLAIKVYTGFSSDQNNKYGLIDARLDGIVFYGFLELLQKALTEQNEWKSRIDYEDFTFFGGKRSDSRVLISSVYVGRDADGVIWVSVVDAIKKDRPRIKFTFGSGRNHHFKHGDGSDYTKADISQLFAKAFYNMLSNVGSTVLVQEYEEPKPRQNNNNNGYNRQNNNNNNNTAGFDDIPF